MSDDQRNADLAFAGDQIAAGMEWMRRAKKAERELAHTAEELRLRTETLRLVESGWDRLQQECRDRENTEADVRARLADAENTLAKVGDLAEKWQADYDNNWNEYGDGYAEDLRAALDGTS